MVQPRKPADPSATDKQRNEYIPSFIAQKPFYLTEDEHQTADYLEHQRIQKETLSDSWYDRGKKLPAATKYRKGACENCGSMSHKTKECLSRPRKNKAKYSNQDIAADEVVQDVQMGWDAKRDRWNGYDPREHATIAKDYERIEELRNKQREAERLEKGEDYDEGDKIGEDVEMPGQTTATRTIRLREDTAKYLLNLDLDSAKYDPKSRAMIDSGAVADQAAALVAEDNFMRASGDAAEFEKAQKYAWEAQERGGTAKQHLQANPTEGEVLRKRQLKEEEEKRVANKKKLLDKYGGEQYLKSGPPPGIAESETFVEYSEDGLIKGAPKVIAKSKYAEDVLIGNHTSVWGSWWSNFKWGYSCCRSFVKNSYCTGVQGIKAFEEESQMKTGIKLVEDAPPPDVSAEVSKSMAKSTLEPIEAKDTTKKRTLTEMNEGVTEEEMDEYRRKRANANDPMAAFLGKDELV